MNEILKMPQEAQFTTISLPPGIFKMEDSLMMNQSSLLWSRKEISACECDEKSYKHVHCPCIGCRGRATDRKTELRHWRETVNELSTTRSRTNPSCPSSLFNDSQTGCTSDDESEISIDEEISIERDEQTMQDEDTTDVENPVQKMVVKAVLDALKIKHTGGASVKTFEEILEYGKTMLFMSLGEDVDREILTTLWPKTWEDAQVLLKEQGYKDVKELFICFCHEEKTFTRNGKTTKKCVYDGNYSVMNNKDDKCSYCGNQGNIKYLYLGLDNKVKNWFRNKDMCEKMLSHWTDRETWLGDDIDHDLRNEIWHGKRWSELKWFWNPNCEWPLPTCCMHCGIPIPAEELINSPSKHRADEIKIVECPVCFESFEHTIKMAKGSPLNIALIAHFDGWQPFGTSYRGSGSFEVTVANLKKAERNHVDEVYVIGFVPCFEVPNIPCALDPFMEPLMKDTCEGFIDGYKVDYPKGITVADYQPLKQETIRLLLLCFTADHPGQCEVGKCLNQGQCPCRRCKLKGQHLQNSANNHYYYGENRFHFRHPWEQRDIATEINNLFDVENETRSSVRKQMSSEKGFTGVSILHKYLYPLYGFDILKHLVYDVYHTVPLNIVKNQLVRALEQEIIDKAKLDEQIENFPWTNEFKDGRVPRKIGNKSIGYWKAESFQKFSFPVANCIMESHLSDYKELEIMSLVSRLTELHFHMGRNGWTNAMIEMHKRLAWRLNILVEEVQGLSMCTISLHNILHIHEDIINFSCPDNYWCAVFERTVKQYVKKTHNGKRIESTFARVEGIREFLKSVSDKDQQPCNGKYDILLVSDNR